VDPPEEVYMERVLHLQCGNMFDVKNINSADVVMMETDIPAGMKRYKMCVIYCILLFFGCVLLASHVCLFSVLNGRWLLESVYIATSSISPL